MITEEEFKHWLATTSKKINTKIKNLKDEEGDIIEFGVYCLWDQAKWIRELGDNYGPSVYTKLNSAIHTVQVNEKAQKVMLPKENFVGILGQQHLLKGDWKSLMKAGSGSTLKDFICRENEIASAMEFLQFQWEQTSRDSKAFNPVCAFHGCPGSGKSRILDELALNLVSVGALPVVVTLNINMTLNEQDMDNFKNALAMRIIYSVCVDAEKIRFDDFQRYFDVNMNAWNLLTLLDELCVWTGCERVVLLLDELLIKGEPFAN
ncbi:hypothetical protein ROZALSC1DRAFT_24951, partial [Rozella allomycis CSF55]